MSAMNYNQVKVIPSRKGSSHAISSIKNNIILPENIEYPPTEIISKLSKSEHLKNFEEQYHEELTKELGYYCDLQSIKSEDTITWSLFGYISRMEMNIQNCFYNELLKAVGFNEDEVISIELWKTLPHPQKLNSRGPEIDVFILGKKYYLIIECKWTSGLGKNQGEDKNLTQIDIRNMFKDGIGKKIIPNKECLVILVANENIDDNIFISWDTLSKFESLPHKETFINYLEWKKEYI